MEFDDVALHFVISDIAVIVAIIDVAGGSSYIVSSVCICYKKYQHKKENNRNNRTELEQEN